MKTVFFALLLFPCMALAQAAPPQSDGGSAFAENLLKKMNQIEYVSYIKAFVAVMEKGEADKNYQWNTQTAAGNIIAGPAFITGANQYCRGFSESYVVGKESQYLTGMACRNGKGGWCKLRPTSTPSCRLTHPDGIAGMLEDTNVAIDKLNNDITRTGNNFNSFKANFGF